MNQIKHYRNSIGATQKELGDLVGVGQSAIDRYESGARKPCVNQCWNIVNALKGLGAKCEFHDVFPNPNTDVLSEPQTNTTANR
ncbi:TPA: helix-turn-helix transcriptional regulator [Vibrio cholerae]|nr:XRE family transcriptional regulator [Vibrio cholerae]HAS4952621.1 helix-turn-helix transcriptional regulator [Vibrio cholerae]HAS5229125.1 helix-turn-helix transcriptional regulator [Vibrio cholerae]HAS5236850.1 helix-turn-helix transcriptional regulator [Vibrio cholerae]HAS5240556.1 helix-turn-helix transcriptional regulator [Vibrio cholerae]